MTELPLVEAFTDGACKGNPGPGGWGAVLRAKDERGCEREKELSGGEALTTNNRMELTAAIEALNALKKPCRVKLSTDSRYVMDGLTKWIHGWRRNGWRTADKKPVKNAELWQALVAAAARHRVEWEWVKGHAGHPENERADTLASNAAKVFTRSSPGRGGGPPPQAAVEGDQSPAPPRDQSPLHQAASRLGPPPRPGED